MKNIIFVIFIVMFGLSSGCLGRLISVLSKVQEPESNVNLESDGEHELVRTKRQYGFGPFGQSSALANANAFNNHFGPHGFGSSSSLAGAQSFNSHSPFGNFGASAANSGSQGFNCGLGGCSGNAGFSGSQTYKQPNGKSFSIAYGQGFSFVPGQKPTFTNSNSISYLK